METLNCWIYGEDVERIFPVKISKTETVADLKEVIKNKNSFQFHGVEAKDLDLYSICLPDDEQLESKLSRWDHSKERKLNGRCKLSTIPPKSKAGVWLIIVHAPSSFSRKIEVPDLAINCWMRGDEISAIFTVKVSSSETVYDLKKVIKNENSSQFRDVDASDLELYKVSFPYEGGDSLKGVLSNLTSPSLENPLEKISKVFSEPLKEDHLHIVVQILAAAVPNVSPFYQRTEYISKHVSEAPLSGGMPSAFSVKQRKNKYLCNHPSDAASPIPVTLLEPIFAEFMDDYRSYEPNYKDNHFIHELSTSMCTFHRSEAARMVAFREILESYGINISTTEFGSKGYRTDGHLMVGKFVALITEGKKEIACSGAEPFLEAICYREFIHSLNEEMGVATLRSVLPCFHIIPFGACVGIVGCAITDKVQANILVPIIPLFWNPRDLHLQRMAARTFGALKIAIEKLKIQYNQPILPLPSNDSFLQCPYPDHYSLTSGRRVSFSYAENQPLRSRLIFYGRSEDNARNICIKFVKKYSHDVHRFCANKGHAPALIAFEKLPDDWYMVIMEVLDINKSSARRIGSYRSFNNYRKTAVNLGSLKQAVFGFIDKLHTEGYVHGDLRDVNLFVQDQQDETSTNFMLLDFDWAGLAETTCYPIYVNRNGIYRPRGVLDGKRIQKTHDIDMLTYLFHPEDYEAKMNFDDFNALLIQEESNQDEDGDEN